MEIDLNILRAEVREWLCDRCNTVYPGPPQAGFACVQCPKCGGTTGPRVTMELRAVAAQLAAARALLREVLDMNEDETLVNFAGRPSSRF